jgi:hypothetical protein
MIKGQSLEERGQSQRIGEKGKKEGWCGGDDAIPPYGVKTSE